MSIADKLSRLSDARDDIITALAGKGVTATGHGFEDFPDDIDSIQQGGGGTTYVLEELTVLQNQWNSYSTSFSPIYLADDVVDGETYTVTWDGVDYQIQARWDDMEEEMVFGNLMSYPFLIWFYGTSSGSGGVVRAATKADHTFSISIGSGGGGNYQTKSVTPTESSQTVTADNGYDALEQVNVGAISSSYVGSNVPRRDSSDLSASGGTVSVPAGYYASAASKAVASGTAGTPTATKGTVEQHSIEVTPSVTNTSGYISGGTKTGTPVTVTASELVSGSVTLTSNNTYNVTNYASVVVNVAGSGGVGTLLKTYSMGTISTTSTQAADTGKTITGVDISDGYDLLIVETSVNSVTNNRHTATVGMILLTASSTVDTKNGATVVSNKWNSKISSSGVTTTRQNTTAYGIYPYSCTITNESISISMYQRYNSTQTGTINGSYTTRVYGVKLYDLIGG